MITTKANARWQGDLKGGTGTMRLPSGAFEGRYSFLSRFERGAGVDTGTNPEELIAAAHAGCYAMALSGRLAGAGFVPTAIEAEAQVGMDRNEGGPFIASSHLVVTATVPGIDDATFQEHAAAAKAGCPVSKALAGVTITLDARLAG